MESSAREVEISDVSRATFLSLLEYVYTDRLVVADGDLTELFIAADRVSGRLSWISRCSEAGCDSNPLILPNSTASKASSGFARKNYSSRCASTMLRASSRQLISITPRHCGTSASPSRSETLTPSPKHRRSWRWPAPTSSWPYRFCSSVSLL
jgi:hypothetical protein